MPRIIYGPKGEEVTGWGKLHNEELHNLLFAKYNKTDQAWAGHVPQMGDEGCIGYWCKSQKERDH
jgi:hypothetical protein